MLYLEGVTLFSQQGLRAGDAVALAQKLADSSIEIALVQQMTGGRVAGGS